jgi:hypothetical protein
MYNWLNKKQNNSKKMDILEPHPDITLLLHLNDVCIPEIATTKMEQDCLLSCECLGHVR